MEYLLKLCTYVGFMDNFTNETIEKIHESDLKLSMSIAGAGNHSISWMLNVPGASNTIVEIVVPYAEASMKNFLGYMPDSIVSTDTAISMAVQSYIAGYSCGGRSSNMVGISCTAAIATNRIKKGDHRAIIAACSKDSIKTYLLVLNKGERTRAEEDLVVSSLLISVVAQQAGIKFPIGHLLKSGVVIQINEVSATTQMNLLSDNKIPYLKFTPDGGISYNLPEAIQYMVFPGSFNPLHDGHKKLVQVIENDSPVEVIYEISIANVDKPPLLPEEIIDRQSQFLGQASVLVTNQPTFIGKSKKIPIRNFLIGWDTARRIIDEKYYENKQDMIESLLDMKSRGIIFYVAGRVHKGSFKRITDLNLPDMFHDLFVEIEENKFRSDISSSEIRDQR